MTLAELKARATALGLTPDEVRQHGSLSKKTTWETAIAEFEQWKEAVDTHCEEMSIPQWTNPEDEDECEDLSQLTPEERERHEIECEKQEQWIDKVTGRKRETQKMEDIAVQRNEEELPFEPTHILIDGEWVENADIVDPSQLPTLKATDERFEAWEPWMIPDAVFNTGRARYSILYFDKWGNCHCKALGDGRWHNFRIETIINCLIPSSSPVEPFTPSSELPPKLTELTEPIDVKENLLRRMAEHGTPPEEIEKLRHEPLDYCTAYLGEFLLTLADSFQELTA